MWYLVLGLLSALYLLTSLVLPSIIGGVFGTYIVRPILWILFALTVYYIARHEGLNIIKFKKIRRWGIGRNPFEAALLIAGFQIALTIIAGLFFGFGKSPYAFTPTAIITNIFFVFSALIGIEIARSYLIKKGTASKKNFTLTLGLITILFMLILLKPTDFTTLNIEDPAIVLRFIGEKIIPLLAMSLFASYLAYLGGALASIAYIGTLQAFQWFSPILPDFDWAITALIGTLAPAIGFLIIQNNIQLMQKKPKGKRKQRKKKDSTLSWTAIATVCVVFVFFSTGFLGVQPTIIYSGSMRSAIDVGDIVLVSEVNIDEIQKGDVIQFKNENMSIPVVHRIYDIIESEDSKVFVTKGDDNDDPDREPVLPNHIMGKVVFNIPKLGWIPITFKNLLNKIGVK